MIEEREYNKIDVVSFFKTDEIFGVLSNMKGKQKILINDIWFSSSEAIYQSLKFPNNKELQIKIASENSPILAKRIATHNVKYKREDWDHVKNNIMRLSIRIRCLQSQDFFNLLLSTSPKQIVEISRKDSYWGALPKETNHLNGKNVLGRLLMELREEISHEEIFKNISKILLKVNNIYINGKQISLESIIDDAKKNHLTIAPNSTNTLFH